MYFLGAYHRSFESLLRLFINLLIVVSQYQKSAGCCIEHFNMSAKSNCAVQMLHPGHVNPEVKLKVLLL